MSTDERNVIGNPDAFDQRALRLQMRAERAIISMQVRPYTVRGLARRVVRVLIIWAIVITVFGVLEYVITH